MDRQIGRQRRFFERIDFLPRLFRRNINCDDIFTALQQRFQHGLSESLLPMNDDTHSLSFPRRPRGGVFRVR